VATAPIRRLAWELPHAAGAALKTKKKKKKKRKKRKKERKKKSSKNNIGLKEDSNILFILKLYGFMI